MKKLCVTMVSGSVTLIVLLLAGCGGGDDSGPSYTKVRGKWAGMYLSPRRSFEIEATITQDGDALVVETTKLGTGHLLTGTIDTNGYVVLTDAFDGEIWTSVGTVSSTDFRIHDYFFDPLLGPDSPEQVIQLSR